MSTMRIKVDLNNPKSFPKGRINRALVDGTTETQIAMQQHQDEQDAMRDVAKRSQHVGRRVADGHDMAR